MTNPTRTQISADVTQPTTTVEIYTSGTWLDISAFVRDVSIDVQSANGPSGLAFGTTVEPRATISFVTDITYDELSDGTNILTDGTNTLIALLTSPASYNWPLLPIRIKHGFSTSAQLTRFSGVITEQSRDAFGNTWTCQGWSAIIASTDIRSPLFINRPIATKTTAASGENPSPIASYTGGIVNYTLWQCGGRPFEQAGSYPNAVFYYSCEHALIAPDFTWIASENAWDALQRLVRAAGGQLYQDSAGTIRYRNPVSLVSGTPSVTFTDTVLTAAQRVSSSAVPYQSISERATIQEALSVVSAQFVTRRIGGAQVIYEDKDPRYLGAVGQTSVPTSVTIDLDTQYPIAAISQIEIDSLIIRSANPGGASVTVATNSSSAQRVNVTITNTLSDPVQVEAIRIVGNPVEPGEEGSASYSAFNSNLASPRTLQMEDSPWIQSRRHAEQLCRMVWDFYAGTGAIRTLGGVPYDPDRNVGELVSLTCATWNIAAAPHVIVAIRPTNGAWMDVDLTPVLITLPTTSETFVVGGTYADNDSLEVTY